VNGNKEMELMYYVFFWVIPRRHSAVTPGNYRKENILHTEHGESLKSRILHLCGEETTRHIRLFEKLRIKSTVTPGNYPKENILHTEHGESLKSRKWNLLLIFLMLK